MLEKKGLTMPKLDLIFAQMPANLVDNVSALERYVVRSVWTDRQYSSLALDHWSRELRTICVQ